MYAMTIEENEMQYHDNILELYANTRRYAFPVFYDFKMEGDQVLLFARALDVEALVLRLIVKNGFRSRLCHF